MPYAKDSALTPRRASDNIITIRTLEANVQNAVLEFRLQKREDYAFQKFLIGYMG
jgi:hypothetical protein